MKIELSRESELNLEGWSRSEIGYFVDVFLKICPRTSLKVSQNQLFETLGPKSGPKGCPMDPEIL